MKTTSTLAIPILVFSILFFTTCKNDFVEPEICTPPINPYENCCGTEPFEATLSIGKMYVPNIATSNQDGFNDGISVYGNQFISIIDSFIISKDGKIIYEELNIPAIPVNGPTWQGTDSLGNLVEGLVDLKFKATAFTGLSGVFTTQVCIIPCGQDGFPIENIGNCRFSSQHDGMGGFNPNLQHFDDDCF